MIRQGATLFHITRYRVLAEWMTSISCVSRLGAGKTTFSRGVAPPLSTHRVTQPLAHFRQVQERR